MVPTIATIKAYKGPARPKIDENAIELAKPHFKAYVIVALTLFFCSSSTDPTLTVFPINSKLVK